MLTITNNTTGEFRWKEFSPMINNYIKKTLNEEKDKLEFENITNQKQVESFARLFKQAEERVNQNNELIQQINDLIEHLDQSQNIP